MGMQALSSLIDTAFDDHLKSPTAPIPAPVHTAILQTIEALDNGQWRVAEKHQGKWITHSWIKKAILLFFKTQHSQDFDAGYTHFYDKVPLKYAGHSADSLKKTGVRIVPPATVRKGAFIATNTVLMPSYVNIGAYVDTGTLIDTWATIGSCAQIGKNVHISGGVGIGGVLEPPQASPTIIEDHCFIGARSEIVEGVIVEEGAVIAMGVFISQSTPIYDRMTQTISYGRIPKGAVVIPGSLPSQDGRYHRYAAIIVKQVDENTRRKTSLNELLRDAHV